MRSFTLFILGLAFLPLPLAAQTPLPVPIDVPAVQVQGTFLVNGSPASPITSEQGALEFEGLLGPGAGVPAGSTMAQAYGPISMVPGTYQPTYSFQSSIFGTLPLNGRVPIGPWVGVDGTQPFDFDIPAVAVTFDVTLNGAPFPVDPVLMNDLSVLVLRHVATGDEFEIGSTLSLPFTVQIVPGIYDLVYEYRQGTLHPVNPHATIATGLDLSSGQTVSLDLLAYTHAASVLVNGVPFPASPTQYGTISIESADGSDRVVLGPTYESLPQRYLLAGSYVLVYEQVLGAASVPLNTRAVVDPFITVDEPSPGRFVSVSNTDIPMSAVTIDGTVNGNPFPASPTTYGNWVAVDDQGNETLLGETFNSTLARNLVHGTYDIVYRWQIGGTDIPRNANARVVTNHPVSGPTTISFDVPMVELSVTTTQDGAPIPVSPTNYGTFELQGIDPADRFPFGSTLLGPTISGLLVPGDYDLIYNHANGAFVPQNTNAIILDDFNTADARVLGVDMPTTRITPLHTLDGQSFPTGTGDSAALFLRSPSGGEVPLGTTDEIALADEVVLDGTYAFEYEWMSGTQIPRNGRERVGYFSTTPEPGLGLGLALGCFALAGVSRRSARSAGSQAPTAAPRSP
ncbi:MAG TPA: hypothetical protein ENI85_10555 [Deltaproteobacteria bacterium]|nr:hypothetical protein [Deltaproteobacteria bacterium]